MVNMIPVSSSNLDSVGYMSDSLYIRFRDGSLYVYKNVPLGVYISLMASESRGSFLHQNIMGRYQYQRIE